jgi:hypothetical protein
MIDRVLYSQKSVYKSIKSNVKFTSEMAKTREELDEISTIVNLCERMKRLDNDAERVETAVRLLRNHD